MPKHESLDELVAKKAVEYADQIKAEPLPSKPADQPAEKLDYFVDKVKQILMNLLSNAVKFVPAGTVAKIQIWTERRENVVRLWVEDNGIGIRPEHQRRLFGLFERIHPEKTFEGTGIGLAIVRKAVERMGGKVGVESDGISGSKFWIELPAVEAPATPAAA